MSAMLPRRATRRRFFWRDRNAELDAETEHREIVRNLSLYDFPWDMNQALSFALFRTYAVPSIGRLLDQTGEFTGACQKRYDDTALLLEAPLVSGFHSVEGRTGVRRINQMHRMYDISNDDMRYVLSTFVVVPKRWLDDFGWRRLTRHEVRASVNYYRELGRHMNIADIPETYEEFADLMDTYEAEHFGFDEGGRRVADATLALMVSFYPKPAAPVVERFSRALMDPPLLAAFGYDDPGSAVRRASEAGMRLRARVLAHAPSRRRPRYIADSPRVKTGAGFDLAQLGTFTPTVPSGATACPAPARRAAT